MRNIHLLPGTLLLLVGCARPPPQADLLIPINPLCTTCEDFVRCDAGSGNAAVYNPTFDLYYLKQKGVAAQIATIWTFLVQSIAPKTEDERPLAVYVQRPGRTQAFERETQAESMATTDLVRHRINVPEGWVDQVNGEWHTNDGSTRGSCRLLSRADGQALLALFRKPAGEASAAP